jgi:ATP-dependent helicase HrpB
LPPWPVSAAEDDQAYEACLLAVVLTEQGLGGSSIDLEDRLRRFKSERGDRADASRGLARRMAKGLSAAKDSNDPVQPGILLMQAFPDRIALQRGGRGTVCDGQRPRCRAGRDRATGEQPRCWSLPI